jgi:hypothetical protein
MEQNEKILFYKIIVRADSELQLKLLERLPFETRHKSKKLAREINYGGWR